MARTKLPCEQGFVSMITPFRPTRALFAPCPEDGDVDLAVAWPGAACGALRSGGDSPSWLMDGFQTPCWSFYLGASGGVGWKMG